MRRRGGRYGVGGKDGNGTPTINPPEPQAIDDYSGFKVPLSALKKDWQGQLTQSPDKRNPQDFLRGIKDNMALPYSRPEPADQFVAGPILWESGAFVTTQSGGFDIFTEGVDPGDSL
jgi:hypothetical protein